MKKLHNGNHRAKEEVCPLHAGPRVARLLQLLGMDVLLLHWPFGSAGAKQQFAPLFEGDTRSDEIIL